MQQPLNEQQMELVKLTVQIVSTQASTGKCENTDLNQLISSVYQTLTTLGQVNSADAGNNGEKKEEPELLKPAVPVRRSVTPDHIICLEDGQKLKMLKRYLMSRYNMTPEQYRERWKLPADYPMVAPGYAAKRSQLAKEIGLGKTVVRKPLRGKRGRPSKKASAA
jgi:predicted transcriptional regulator